MKEATEQWLRAAEDDLRVVARLANDDDLTHMVAFHSQQCIEKCCKAIIEEHELGHVRIHNLGRLFEIVRPKVPLDANVCGCTGVLRLCTERLSAGEASVGGCPRYLKLRPAQADDMTIRERKNAMIGIHWRSILLRTMMSFAAVLFATDIAFSAEIQLKFDPAGRFKIVQFTDMHLHEGGDKDRQTLALIGEVLDIEKPQLVVLTGDTIAGAAKRQETVALAAGPMAERKIPWAVTLGNHDDEWPKDVEKPKDRRGLMEMFVRQPCSVSKVGPQEIFGASNYCLPIYNTDGTQKKWVLYMLDSNTYTGRKELGTYDWIHTDQIAWYSQTSKTLAQEQDGRPCPALAFFHIPLLEYEYALTDAQADVVGNRHEGVASSRINSGLFAAMLERGDMKGVFVGHDHVSDFEAQYRGIRLIYGRGTGFDTYGRDGFPRGARVIQLEENGETFTTWIRLQGGDKVQY